MKQFGVALVFLASVCAAQEPAGLQPATTNVWGAEYPRVDGAGRVEIRIKAPEATKVRLNFWAEGGQGETGGRLLDLQDGAARPPDCTTTRW
jgi:hypothetical protein